MPAGDSGNLVPSVVLSRRDLLKRGTGVVFSLTLLPAAGRGDDRLRGHPRRGASVPLNAYVHIATDGTVTICCPSAEMGQGVLTALPVIVAEEMDADWSRVIVTPSPPVGDDYGDPLFINLIFTVASRSVAGYFERLRIFGAQARRTLVHNAARNWNVPVAGLETKMGQVLDPKSGRHMGYGEIAGLPGFDVNAGQADAPELKDPSRFQLIGRDVEPRNLAAKVDGSVRFSIDASLPGMVHAAVIRPPFAGSRIKSIDDRDARKAPGVSGVHRRDETVAVVARTWFEALAAKRAIRVEWQHADVTGSLDSQQILDRSIRDARDTAAPGIPWDGAGDAPGRLAGSHRVIEREYSTEYMYHGGMEPMNATVHVHEDGSRAEIWAGTQAPGYTLDTVARITGIDAANITLHRSLMGGAFGRRSVHAMDFVQDAAWLSAQLRKPVKVIWDREEDFKLAYLRPATGQYLRAALDESGRVTAWHHRVACEDPVKAHEPLLWEAWQQAPLIGMLGSEHRAEDGSPFDAAYDLPDRLVEYVAVESGIRVYAMRGVGAMPNKFAIESFLDELCAETGSDPLAFRLQLLHRSARAQQVLQKAAEISQWGRRREGRGLGLAYSHYAGSLIACVAEVSTDHRSGQIRVHDVWVVVDCGLVIQPDNLVAQLEGGVIYGLSNALTERITIENGMIMQSNFHDYQMMRISSAPEIHVHTVHSTAPPTGVGEIGTVVAPAALANAFAALTGRRLRRLPFTPEQVRAAASGNEPSGSNRHDPAAG